MYDPCQQKQSAQPAPAMTRDEMVTVGTNALIATWAKSDAGDLRAQATAVVDALHPELKPEAKTAGQVFADQFYTFCGGVSENRRIIASAFDSAVAARDAAHQTAMAGLRTRCVDVAERELELMGAHGTNVFKMLTALLAVPLEAK